jgi:hypothetical protein
MTAVRGKTRSRSERGRSEVVGLAREVVRVTAVRPASCGGVTAVARLTQVLGGKDYYSICGMCDVKVSVRSLWRNITLNL